ncbi:MAG: ABC transporter permease subunit [Bauldia sp.]|nr:ABC transporter permease subunit [Bauldia sp.]
MTRIAISYRRQDSAAIAGRIFDRLVARYGDHSVFMDVESIPFGVDFRAHLEEELGKVDLLLVIIGNDWLGARADGGSRLRNPADPTRLEVEAALKTGVSIIPVLVDSASMPDATALPEPVAALARLNPVAIDGGDGFENDMERLVGAIDALAGASAPGAADAVVETGSDVPADPGFDPAEEAEYFSHRGDRDDGHTPGEAAEVEPGFAGTMMYVRREEEPVLPPPRSSVGAVGWARQNLFSSVGNTILTIVGIVLIALILPPIIRWAFIDAVWVGDGREDCVVPGAGACWAFVEAKFGQFIYGRYPLGERWRVDLTAILLIIGIVLMAVPRIPYKRESAIYLFAIFPIIALVLLTGGNFDISIWTVIAFIVLGCLLTALVAAVVSNAARSLGRGTIALAAVVLAIAVWVGTLFLGNPALNVGNVAVSLSTLVFIICGGVGFIAGLMAIAGRSDLPGGRAILGLWLGIGTVIVLLGIFAIDFGLTHVETPLWGGLLVTLVVALSGMGASMPLGIALALGRRSQLPVIRFASIAFIEFVRGVPLITVLFMASVMLPLFLPPGVNFDKLLRALIGVALFEAAYMAEVVRGGLQAIPAGQYEAARAVGLKYWQSMRLIILPQALKIVIPGIVNSFISLFKDTSLVLIIGIFDLLGIVQANFTDSNWASPATPATGYVFAAVIFWIFCFGMSRYSIYTERRLDTGYRN